jgi:hypothetical protein
MKNKCLIGYSLYFVLATVNLIMSIKTTHHIDRQTALAVIVSKINNCSNDQLANILEEFDESYFRNYLVYDNLPDKDGNYVIKTVSDF